MYMKAFEHLREKVLRIELVRSKSLEFVRSLESFKAHHGLYCRNSYAAFMERHWKKIEKVVQHGLFQDCFKLHFWLPASQLLRSRPEVGICIQQ